MDLEIMDLEQLAVYLQRDVREVTKMASRGHLPGQKVAGEWRFASAEINYWISTQLHEYDEAELAKLESGAGRGQLDNQPLLSELLTEQTMAVPLAARTRGSVLKELVRVAEQSWVVFDAEAILKAVEQREEMGSTAMPCGVAIPHPRRPLPGALGESLVVFARTDSGVPFGGTGSGLCDLFFLVCCRNHGTHMRVLARLSRLLLQEEFVAGLRGAETATEAFKIIAAAESALLANLKSTGSEV